MAAVKDIISVESGTVLAGGGGPTLTGYVDMRTAYGGIWLVTFTNSSNKMSKGAQVQAQVSDLASADAWDFDCRQIAGDAADQVTRVAIRIPAEVNRTRLSFIHADSNVTIDAKFIRLTQV